MEDITLQNKKQDRYLHDQLVSGDFVGFMLFVGQEGVGKRGSAYSFAESVLCESGNGEPCQLCASCKLLASETHPDLIKIGGEGTIKIAEIRDLQKKLYLKPYRADHKVAVIEDAHLMTEESANALLKILEEPPKDSIIILVSPDKTMFPETVVSRSQIVNFGTSVDGSRIINEELAEDVSKILEGSGGLPEKFSVTHKYAVDKKSASDFLGGLEVNLRTILLEQSNPIPGVGLRGISESNTIKALELVQKSRGYLKANLAGKFVLENLILNMR